LVSATKVLLCTTLTRSRGSSRLRLPFPRQQIGQVGRGAGRDPTQHVGQPCGRIETISAGCDKQVVDYFTAPSGVWVPNEEPVLLSDAGWADRILHQVRIDVIPAVFEVAHQRLPLIQCVRRDSQNQAMAEVSCPAGTGLQFLGFLTIEPLGQLKC